MDNWVRTNELRFVEREHSFLVREDIAQVKIVRILQQKWIKTNVMLLTDPPKPIEEWRDIPLELET